MSKMINSIKLTSLAVLMAVSAGSMAEKIAITGAKVYTMGAAGTLDNATVLINDANIEQVLEGNTVPSGYREIDASGKVLTPGLFAAYTSLGLTEVSMSAGTVDASVDAEHQHGLSNVGAAYDVQYGINNDSTVIPITRIEGFTSAATSISRTGQLFSGQGAVISLKDGFDLVLKGQAYTAMDVTNNGADNVGESRAALWVSINAVFDEVLAAKGMRFSPSQEWHGMSTVADVKALSPVLSGDIPLLVRATRAADIMQVIKLKQRYSQLNVVLMQATDAWRVADEIAKANIAVILDPENNLPGSFDQLGATLENAARLHKAGVKVSIGMDTHNVRLAAQHAGNAVANGLPHEAGLAALTINPATIYGMDKRIGSIESGKQADVVIWSGDPLEVTEAAEQVFIAGEAIDMSSRQTKLRDRYMKRAAIEGEAPPSPHIR